MGNVFSAGLGFFSLLLISRTLSVGEFGLFNIAISIMIILQPLASLGMNTTTIRFVSAHLGRGNTDNARQILQTTLLTIFSFSFVIMLFIILTADFISEKVLHQPDQTALIRTASWGIMTIALFYYSKAVFCAFQRFRGLVSLQVFLDILKLVVIAALIYFSRLSASTAVVVFVLVPIVGFMIGLNHFRDFFIVGKLRIFHWIGRLLSYGIWIFISSICEATFLYVGVPLLGAMKGNEAAGIFGLALNLAYVFPLLIMALSSVLLPEVSRFKESKQFENYLRGSVKILLSSGILVIPAVLLSSRIIPFLFGIRYVEAVPVFNIFLISFLAFAALKILTQALYALDKPRFVAGVDMTRLAIMITGSLFLISPIGVFAPAISALAANLFGLAVLGSYFSRELKRKTVKLPGHANTLDRE